jgi:hypothetical protein
MNMTRQYGGTEKIEAVSVCAVYDPLTGDIHHWHHCLTIAGGQHPSTDQIAKDALAAVRHRATPVTGALAVLHVDPATETSKPYRVDHDRQALTAYESPGAKK